MRVEPAGAGGQGAWALGSRQQRGDLARLPPGTGLGGAQQSAALPAPPATPTLSYCPLRAGDSPGDRGHRRGWGGVEGNERAREGRGLEEGGDGTGDGGLGWGGQGGQEQRSDGELKERARAG